MYYVVGTNVLGCSTNDSIFIDTFPQLSVVYDELSNLVDITTVSFNLSLGIPSGGNYSGNGVIGTTFHPAIAGIGNHQIIYTFIDTNNCSSSDTSFIEVNDTLDLDLSLIHISEPTRLLSIAYGGGGV